MESEFISAEQAESLEISQAAYNELCHIIGRSPTIDELSTLIAMWQSNGKQQSLVGWLKGQHDFVEKNDYLYNGVLDNYKTIREPRVKDCIAIAQQLNFFRPDEQTFTQRGDLLYLVGNISTEFANSQYARQYLHIANNPIHLSDKSEEIAYTQLIVDSMAQNGLIRGATAVSSGGIFGTLLAISTPPLGFDIITCREIRLDAFLFGEESGRFIVSLPESLDDIFLSKLDEARLNGCFLGHATKNRILIDDMDFGSSDDYRNRHK